MTYRPTTGDELMNIFRKDVEFIQSGPMCVELEAKHYIIDKPLFLPKTFGTVVINGNGARIKQVNGTVDTFLSVAHNQTEAVDIFSQTRYIFNDLELEARKYAINLGGHMGCVLNNIHSIGGEGLAHLKFCLHTQVNNCLATNYNGIAFFAGLGRWIGSSSSKSQSNKTEFKNCRAYAKKDGKGLAAYYVEHSSQVRIIGCTSEGHDVEHALIYEQGGNGHVKSFTLEDFHIEHKPSRSSLRINSGSGHIVDLKKIHHHSVAGSHVFMEMNNGDIRLTDCLWFENNWKIESFGRAPRLEIINGHPLLRLGSLKHGKILRHVIDGVDRSNIMDWQHVVGVK